MNCLARTLWSERDLFVMLDFVGKLTQMPGLICRPANACGLWELTGVVRRFPARCIALGARILALGALLAVGGSNENRDFLGYCLPLVLHR